MKIDQTTIKDFTDFLLIDQHLSPLTAKKYRLLISHYLEYSNELSITKIREFLRIHKDKPSYRNYVKALRVLCGRYLRRPELTATFKIPATRYQYKILPSKEDLKKFYNELPDLKAKVFFMLYASSGLRRQEVLDLNLLDIDLEKRMIIPNHFSNTKNTLISFYNEETETILREYLSNRNDSNQKLFPISITKTFNKIWKKTS